ncbi:MAG TPA: peptidylprolyl isomerase [Candidatus Binatia bacterium]|nr:peptidylprolyl isomerase [Candidatus Binatia bacterium]
MRHRFWLLCLLGGGLAWAQAKPAGSGSAQTRDDDQPSVNAASSIAMDAPVLTIKGICTPPKTAGNSSACETVITREQFEKVVAAIHPNMSLSAKEQLAILYPRLLVMTQSAEELGLDKQAPYEQMIAFSRMQILTQGLTRKLQAEAAPVSDEEIAEYYRKNAEKFEVYTLERLLVPLHKLPAKSSDGKTSQTPQQSDEELAGLAQRLRARGAAGEDFVKLQQEAFEAAGVKVASANTHMEKVRRSSVPVSQGAVFDLKAGEVSQVFSDAGGHYIFRMDSKGQLPLEDAKAEIRQTLTAEHAKAAVDKVEGSITTERNQAYFAVGR